MNFGTIKVNIGVSRVCDFVGDFCLRILIIETGTVNDKLRASFSVNLIVDLMSSTFYRCYCGR